MALIVVAAVVGTVGVVVIAVIVGAGTMPVPLKLMSKAMPTLLSLLAIWMAAVFAPADVGANCTVKVVLPLAAMVAAGDEVTVKSELFVPSSVTPVTLSEALLLLLRMVKDFDSVLPTFTLP